MGSVHGNISSKATYHSTFGWSISPWFVITWENSKMASPNKLLVVKAQNRVATVQKVRMEYDFHAIVGVVEQLDTANLTEDGIVGVVGHVMSDDRRKRIPLQCKDATL